MAQRSCNVQRGGSTAARVVSTKVLQGRHKSLGLRVKGRGGGFRIQELELLCRATELISAYLTCGSDLLVGLMAIRDLVSLLPVNAFQGLVFLYQFGDTVLLFQSQPYR